MRDVDLRLADEASAVLPDLSGLVETWRGMPRTNPQKQQRSEEYYKSTVFPQVLGRMVKDRPTSSYPKYDLLIGPLGTSPEPLMITVSLLKPARVVFLCSTNTECFIPSILERSGHPAQDSHKKYIEKDDSLLIYEAVHAAYQEEAKRLGRQPRVAIDMTGGTKLMGAGCAMAGIFIEADIYYVAGDFDPLYRRPVPGTERLVRFQDPYAEFGHLEVQKAVSRFVRHDYAGAAEIFQEIADRVSRPRTYECLSNLSRAYDFWSSLRFTEALTPMKAVLSSVKRFPNDSPTMAALPLPVLEQQAAALERLADAFQGGDLSFHRLQDTELFSALLFSITENAARAAERKNYDAATLLLYRAIEMMCQRRLAMRGFDTSDADYSLLGIDPECDTDKINRADLMDKCNLHTILRLPTGIFYAQGVKTNVLFFTRGQTDHGNTEATWIYDMRTNMPGFGKRTPFTREYFREFEACYGDDPRGTLPRTDGGEESRFRRFTRDEVRARAENLDITWLRDESAERAEDLPEPDEIAAEILAHLRTAMDEMEALAELLENG